MRRTSRLVSAAALAGALSLIAAPALANGSGQYVDSPPWSWYVAAGSGEWGVDEGSYNDDFLSVTDAWGTSYMEFFNADSIDVSSADAAVEPAVGPSGVVRFACTTSTLSADGADQVVSCDDTVTTPWGLSVTSDVRVLAPGDLARVTYFVTNTTTAPVALGYEYFWSYGSSTSHVRSTVPDFPQDTGAGEGLLASPDVWSFNDGNLNAGVAWGIGGQPFLGSYSDHSGFSAAVVGLLPSAGRTVAAGETIALAFFHKMQQPEPPIDRVSATADAAAAAPQPVATGMVETPAMVMAEFASFDGRLTRGLPADVRVGNWQPADAAAAAPELADTGVDATGGVVIGGLAAALLGAGAAFLIGRRAAANARR